MHSHWTTDWAFRQGIGRFLSLSLEEMCGLAGVHRGAQNQVESSLLLAMAGEMRHRGPDGTGLYLDGPFGMTNTRLAIIDLAGGDQPLSEERGRYWVMQDGEIYNYVELMDELRQLGHRFATSCDTEVIAHAYEEWGLRFLDRLNGDFAIAVWDRERQEVLLARDRFGVRPLFLAEPGGGVFLRSEAKAPPPPPRSAARARPGRDRGHVHHLVD